MTELQIAEELAEAEATLRSYENGPIKVQRNGDHIFLLDRPQELFAVHHALKRRVDLLRDLLFVAQAKVER